MTLLALVWASFQNKLADYLLPHPLLPPLQTVRLENALNSFVWRGGRTKRGVSPLLDAPLGEGGE